MAENRAPEYDLLAWLARVDAVDVEDFDLREGRADVGLSTTKVQSLAIRASELVVEAEVFLVSPIPNMVKTWNHQPRT